MNNAAEQRSEAWHMARAGKITASCFVDCIAVTKAGKPTAARGTYMRKLAFERLAGIPVHEIGGKALNWGAEVEGPAVQTYELVSGNIVTPSEFLVHPKYAFIGGSPDGLVSHDGGIEIKSPHDEGVHINTWLNGMPEEHMPQVQGNMFVTGRAWWDFISYDPRQCERLRLYVQRIPRDDAYIADLAAGLLQFEAELQQMLVELDRKSA
jgi:predicted phage-related endonuclease